MTSKEALKDLKSTINALSTFLQRSSKKEYQDLKIIEKDLERLEALEKENEKLSIEIDDLLDDKIELVVKNKQQDMLIGKLIQENEKLKQENQELLVNKNVAKDIATKYKKTLDIIKIKIIDVVELKFSYSVIEYNLMARNSDFDELTKEEYELLKEVLK